jgi:diadenosine tetraphosphate (Ap4A) HIT family hydrolase
MGKPSDSSFRIYSGSCYTIDQCHDCPVPGYLVITPVSQAQSIEKLSAEEQIALGEILARAVWAIRQVVEPVKIYCAHFGEKNGPLHFHIFPRTREITRQYLEENPSERNKTIDGPRLLAWARRRILVYEDRWRMEATIDELREAIRRKGQGEKSHDLSGRIVETRASDRTPRKHSLSSPRRHD